MSSGKFLKIWAAAATGVALLLAGFVAGTWNGGRQAVGPAQVSYSQPTDPNASRATNDAIAPYVVPDAFADLPAEWHTPFDGTKLDGYAIAFDPHRRQVIVEQCRHRGYVDSRTGDIVQPGWEFCDNVLRATLARLDAQSATAIGPAQEPVELALALEGAENEPRLALSFPGHRMVLQPGSKNDLYQAMDRSPRMRQEKEVFHRTLIREEDARRRILSESAVSDAEASVPTYTLPAPKARVDDTR